MPSQIPQARKALEALTVRIATERIKKRQVIDAINSVIPMLKRDPATRKTTVRSRPMTWELAQEIRAYAKKHPRASHQEIGDHFKVNTGRVSEVLNNLKWTKPPSTKPVE